MVRKQNALQNKMTQVMKRDPNEDKAVNQQFKASLKKDKEAAKVFAESLGKKKAATIHINKYTNELKNLIGKLHDDDLDKMNIKGNVTADQKD